MQLLSHSNPVHRSCLLELQAFHVWKETGVIPNNYPLQFTEEEIERYKAVPAENKLHWLEEAQDYVYHTLGQEGWELLKRFRCGEI